MTEATSQISDNKLVPRVHLLAFQIFTITNTSQWVLSIGILLVCSSKRFEFTHTMLVT